MITRFKTWYDRLTLWRMVTLTLLALGLYAGVIRFTRGLGAATHLSDSFPWGLWIGFDVLVGVGLAAGGFVIAATVHVFRLKRFEPIARPTILTAFLGYLLVVVALFFDLGRPWNIWHPLVMWNPHSVMFEVGWCVMLYTTVLALEFSPLVLERLGLTVPLRVVRSIYVPLVILGVLLSTLHQSSLGTLYVIAPDKLYGLWYTPLLPVFFFLTAVAGGLAMTIFESFLSQRAFGKKLERSLLEALGRAGVVVLGIYIVWRLEDIAGRGNFGLIFQLTPESSLFWGEILLGAILPMVLFATPRIRRSESGLFFAAVLTVMGFILYRLNVAVTGMTRASGTVYLPSWMELSVTASVVAMGFVLFGFAVRHLAIFPRAEVASPIRDRVSKPSRPPRGTVPKGALAGLWLLFIVGAVIVGAGLLESPDGSQASVVPVPPGKEERPVALHLPPPFLFPPSEDSPGPVTFDHRSHVDERRPRCAPCHSELFSLLRPGQPQAGPWTYESVHEGALCASCHDGDHAHAMDECDSCHRAED